jgi:predicted DNA-binding transcriptional regulator AlpA
MNEPAKRINSQMVVQLSADELRSIIRDEVQATLKTMPRDDKLLTVAEVCATLNCNEEWVYHNARKLPFVRKVGGMLRFSSNGLQRYIESRKFTAT